MQMKHNNTDFQLKKGPKFNFMASCAIFCNSHICIKQILCANSAFRVLPTSFLSLFLIFIIFISKSKHCTLFISMSRSLKFPSVSYSFIQSCISLSFVNASAYIESVSIHWYDAILPSLSHSFKC